MSIIETILDSEILLKLYRYIFYVGLFTVVIARVIENKQTSKIMNLSVFIVWVTAALFLILKAIFVYLK